MSPHAVQREQWLFRGAIDRDREDHVTPKELPDPPLEPEITADDIARAKQAWRETAPPQFRELLEGEKDDEK